MLLLGIDIGTSSVKVSVVDSITQKVIASSNYPEQEASIISLHAGWAEQPPEQWWQYFQQAFKNTHAKGKFDPKHIAAIGIGYQMHGLVLIDKNKKVLRDSIIWCDSRSVEIGNEAFQKIGEEKCLSSLLNSPGNFTASKLAWVKKNEPELYKKIYKIMLPGDFIAMKLTGEVTTTPSALSEGIFWDFNEEALSKDIIQHFEFDESIIPEIRPVFSNHGNLLTEIADEIFLQAGIPVSYKAGDQLNNAVSLNVFQPGEVAATAGTSGVIYAVTDKLFHDKYSRINAFAHVNHTSQQKRIGVLLCINGSGIMQSWIKNICGNLSYEEIDRMAEQISPGASDLMIFPFGNGAERMFQNKQIGAHVINIDLNKHKQAHVFRAVQEGIAFSFRYGFDIMKKDGLSIEVIRAGRSNLFLSDVFVHSFVNTTGVPVELYSNDGSAGAAIGSGIGAGIYKNSKEAFTNFKPLKTISPDNSEIYEELYANWRSKLELHLSNN